MHCARRRRRADAMTQTPDTKPGNYYVSIVRGKDHRLLAGPFVNNHAGALAMVDAARDLAHEIDPRTCFDAFGTCRVDGYYDKPGILNAQLGLGGCPCRPSRSAQRRVGKAWVSTCRSRWCPC